MKATKRLQITRWRDGYKEITNNGIPVERATSIYLNDKEIVTLMSTPLKIKELAIGFLISEGFLKKFEELEKVYLDNKKGIAYVETKNKKPVMESLLHKRYLTSGCGRGVTFSNLSDALGLKPIKDNIKFSPQIISALMKNMLEQAKLYKEAGGIHCSALTDKNGLISISEDIARHNTFDKIFGECFLSKIKTEGNIIMTTGRISSEMLFKVIKAGIPIIASRTSPTDFSVEVGKKLGITIIGYVRSKGMNIYTHPERISVSQK